MCSQGSPEADVCFSEEMLVLPVWDGMMKKCKLNLKALRVDLYHVILWRIMFVQIIPGTDSVHLSEGLSARFFPAFRAFKENGTDL